MGLLSILQLILLATGLLVSLHPLEPLQRGIIGGTFPTMDILAGTQVVNGSSHQMLVAFSLLLELQLCQSISLKSGLT